MNFFEKKEIKLISRLNKLTSKSELEWVANEPPQSMTKFTDEHISLFFQTNYESKRLVVFQRNYQTYYDDFDQMYWTERVSLGILDDQDRLIWEYSDRDSSSALNDLFQTIRSKVAGVDDLFSSL